MSGACSGACSGAGRSIVFVIAGAIVLAAGPSAEAAARPPNVVVIIADDMGWGDLSLNGNASLRTPHLDRLAAEGAAFQRFYVQPVCAPTRAEFLTARYAARNGVTGVSAGRERLDPAATTIADIFSRAGYTTAAFGKWHNGTQAPYHPLCRGFDEFYGFTSGHWGHYYDFWLDRNGRMVKGVEYAADDFTNHAQQFVDRNHEKPFFLLLAFNTPHSPMQAPDKWWARHAGRPPAQTGTDAAREDERHTRAALAMCENLDDNVGRLMHRIAKRDLDRETIVVFFSDNGPNGHRWNGGMKGIKGSTDEGGVRSPLLVRWPGRVPAGATVARPAAAIDLLPTLARLAGVPTAGLEGADDAEPLDGLDLSAALQGGRDAAEPPRPLYASWRGRHAARFGDELLDAEGQQFDLRSDPTQTTDLRERAPERHAEIASRRDAWLAGLPPEPPPRPFDVGHASLPLTQLPVRDARAEGDLRRSNRYPNCSYFTGWDTPDDRAVWSVRVHEPGSYRAVLYLGAIGPTSSRSLQIRCDAGETLCPLPPLEGNEPIGPADDRSPRKESDLRDFQPVDVGDIELAAGEQEIVVAPADRASGALPDLWLLTLERIESER